MYALENTRVGLHSFGRIITWIGYVLGTEFDKAFIQKFREKTGR